MTLYISDADIELVRHSVDLLQVLQGRGVQCKSNGKYRYKACCPFHGEKTPSFMVDTAKQKFYCFGCGVGGDVFRFIEQYEGVGFLEAVADLAEENNISLEDEGFEKYVLLSLTRKARQEEESKMVFPGKGGGDGDSNLVAHEVGWPDYCVPIWDERIPSINKYAEARGFPPKLLSYLGVAGCLRGTYAGRLILPVFRDGKLVFWQARDALGRENVGKYLSPRGASSGNCVFNLERSATYDETIICEGWFSALRTGPDAVATFTCNLTETQVQLMKLAGVTRVCLCYDPDAWALKPHQLDRGFKEPPMQRALTRLVKSGFESVRVARLAGGDPDDLGGSTMREFIGDAKQVSSEIEVATLFL